MRGSNNAGEGEKKSTSSLMGSEAENTTLDTTVILAPADKLHFKCSSSQQVKSFPSLEVGNPLRKIDRK